MASHAESSPRPRGDLTVADYMAMEGDQRHELIEGELVVPPSPTWQHQSILVQLTLELGTHVRREQLGRVFVAPFDVVLFEHTVLQPDLLFVQEARWAELSDAHTMTGAPDLVVEVLSPSTATRDRSVKRDLYRRAGVPTLLLIEPATRTCELYGLSDDAERYDELATAAGSDTLSLDRAIPGFELDLRALWPDSA